jgi:hypothetical protein
MAGVGDARVLVQPLKKAMSKSKPKWKIDLRPGTKLSEQFHNRHDCFKVVEDSVLGYVVTRGNRDATASVWPIYRADVHTKVGKVWHITSSYEQGDRLNDYSFYTDYEGCTFATIASQAISALEERAAHKARAAKTTKRRRS